VSRQRVDIVSPPMSGHLHPLLGIGVRLAADFDVRVLSTSGAQAEIAAAGLSGVSLLDDADAAIASIVNPPHSVGSNPFRLIAQLRGTLGVLERLGDQLTGEWRAVPPDLVIADFTVPVAGVAADRLGLPWWTALPSPCAMETAAGPPGYLGGWSYGDSWPWRLRDAAGRLLVRSFKRVVFQSHRTTLRRLGFDRVYRADGTEAIYSPSKILALAPAELEFPRGYPACVEFVGPVLYTPPVESAVPPRTLGRPRVLVSLGTHLAWRKAAVSEAVSQAAQVLPAIDFHVSDGDRSSSRLDRQGNLTRCGFVSYARDLRHYDLIVHHGGAGILAHALANGLPALVVPADYDQFDNAARLVAAGVAKRVKRLSDLSLMVPAALSDQGMRSRCLALQARLATVRAEDRVAELVSARLRQL
jgi:UDP:flavonoid glycosyltransferase YjiC (YdhE family)